MCGSLPSTLPFVGWVGAVLARISALCAMREPANPATLTSLFGARTGIAFFREKNSAVNLIAGDEDFPLIRYPLAC